MNTKLTLSIEKEIIEQAKKFAAEKKITLSKLIENYLTSLLLKNKSLDSIKISDKEILKNAGSVSVDKSREIKDLLTDKLIEKYIHD